MKILFKDITIKALKGKKTIARSEMFNYLDSDFENYGTDKIGEVTKEMPLAMLEINEDGTFEQIFARIGKKEECVMSQEQILDFIENHNDKLRSYGFATFFLFKVGEDFFVASVRVRSDGSLEASVGRFSYDYVWGAGDRLRVVVPQLALKTSDSGTLESSALGHFCPHCQKEIKVKLEALKGKE